MSVNIIETSEDHARMHKITEGALRGARVRDVPTYWVNPTTLTIQAKLPGEKYNKSSWGRIIQGVTPERELEDRWYRSTYGEWRKESKKYETPESRHAYPLHVVAMALRGEFGDELTIKLSEERALARRIARQPDDELGDWAGLYVIAALLIQHHRAQQNLREVLIKCSVEDTDVTNQNAVHAESFRLARESGNPYLARGLLVAPNLQPNFPLESLAKAADRTVTTNNDLFPGFRTEHIVEPTGIRPVDEVLQQNGLLARHPKTQAVAAGGVRSIINRIFGDRR